VDSLPQRLGKTQLSPGKGEEQSSFLGKNSGEGEKEVLPIKIIFSWGGRLLNYAECRRGKRG